MKMRKMFPAALLVIAAVSLLSGCSAMFGVVSLLENSVTVTVMMDTRLNPDFGSHEAVFQLHRAGGGLVAQQSVAYEYVFNGWAYYRTTIRGIPDGQYSLKACFDRPGVYTFSTYGPWATAFLDPGRAAVSPYIMIPSPYQYGSSGRSVSLQAILGDPMYQF